jgi:hypothetical protein
MDQLTISICLRGVILPPETGQCSSGRLYMVIILIQVRLKVLGHLIAPFQSSRQAPISQAFNLTSGIRIGYAAQRMKLSGALDSASAPASVRYLLYVQGAAWVQSPAAMSTRFASSGSSIGANMAAG